MLKRITWRWWTGLAVILAAYVGCGFWLGSNGSIEETIYKWGLLGASLAPFAFAAVYTASGNRWYANDVGGALMQASFCEVPISGPLAYVFWVNHGILTSSLLAWVEVSGPVLSTLAMLRLCYVFARIHRAGDGTSSSKEEGA